jgi:hypothetical protein
MKGFQHGNLRSHVNGQGFQGRQRLTGPCHKEATQLPSRSLVKGANDHLDLETRGPDPQTSNAHRLAAISEQLSRTQTFEARWWIQRVQHESRKYSLEVSFQVGDTPG